ncbi:DUF4040 family protein [Mobilicoccus pelagius]|uniref:Na(+)/H(+) antiporter subunit A/B n=1 Tax=Mobilicoccus pelagius NBRC 104925 TaxID=1089455 RepID=H5USP9_9MICO|nr:DUF4040 family protein [Mobilicoccus pelagius]GAB48757.1 Na(+)/H(+) antiporter subunit A/B [Mobilicoccus pelagius NBRC 104925]
MTATTSMPFSLALLLFAVAATPLLCRVLHRNAGFVLAAIYVAAAAVLVPTAREVLAGGRPAWSVPWVPSLGASMSLRADGLGIVFAAIALLVGAVVLIYATRYLDVADADGRPLRHTAFYVVMATFTLAMTGLVLADDLVWFFVCWEATSIASFLLVGQGGRGGQLASLRTMFLTFVGGLTLLVAVGTIVARTGTTTMSTALADPVWTTDPASTAAVAVLVLVAGFTKSAQFPFHVWLPDAMSASTPVSAYLHAAAVVKAGIFLLLRFSPAFHATPVWNVLLIVTGLFTAALAAFFALQQTDLKKLMAYSTVSQLGLVVAAIGVGTEIAVAAAVLHVIAHALFKSGLFMMVGVVDHAAGTRDMRRLPSLWRAMPLSFTVTVIGAASMAGVPPLLGFVSKEGLLTALHGAPGGQLAGWTALVAGAAASVLTFGYCVKIVFGGFVDGTRDLGPGDESGLAVVARDHDGEDRHLHTPGPIFLGAASLPILLGIPLGLAVWILDTPVLRAAEAARPGGHHHVHLALWHGLTAPLVATLVVFALGLLVIAVRHRLWPRLERPLLPFDGAGAIAAITGGLRRVGLLTARTVAGHHPARQLTPVLAAFAVLVLGGALTLPPLPPSTPGLSQPYDAVVLLLATASVLLVVSARSRLAAVIGLSAVGILITLQMVRLGAPDVALTQLLVEALTIVVIMLVLQKLPLTFGAITTRARVSKGIFALAVGLAAGVATWVFSGRRGRSDLAEYYLSHTTEISGGHNVVNVILVEFRALDTLGELSVLGMTGIALVAVLSTVRDRALDPHPVTSATAVGAPEASADTTYDTRHAPRPELDLREPGSTAHRAITEAWPNTIGLQLMLRIMVPILAIASLGLFWRGHSAPGGGFIAALVGSSIVGLVYLSTSRDRQIGPPRLPVALIGGGIVTAVSTGIGNLLASGSFLQPSYGHVGSVHLTTSMIFDAGVYMAVLGLVMAAFNLLGTGESTDTERTHERAEEMTEGEIVSDAEAAEVAEARRSGGGHKESRARARTTFIADGDRPADAGRPARAHPARAATRATAAATGTPTTDPSGRTS